MDRTTDISTGIGAARFGRDHTFAGRSRSRLLREAAEWMDRQRAVSGRFTNVIDEDLKEEGAK